MQVAAGLIIVSCGAAFPYKSLLIMSATAEYLPYAPASCSWRCHVSACPFTIGGLDRLCKKARIGCLLELLSIKDMHRKGALQNYVNSFCTSALFAIRIYGCQISTYISMALFAFVSFGNTFHHRLNTKQ